jgi:AGCS family alanine or glycine:cation symporter
MCIGGAFGGGNMFQANQAYAQVASVIPLLAGRSGAIAFGVTLAAAVGLVIVGGIRRIGEVASVLVPFMCILYVLCGMWILLVHADRLAWGLAEIVRQAFAPDAAWGGFVGVLVQGFRRAAFSNEAGIGSAPIAHSTAATREPVREGIVSLLEPFVDTVVVCNMTALVLVVTGAYQHPDAGSGIAMTSWAFATVFPWFPLLLSLTALLFAFATQISWSYYGEQCWAWLFGLRSIGLYKALFLFFVWFGSVSQLERVIEFSDLMILGMAFPNIAGVVLLSAQVKRELDRYWGKLRAGEFAGSGRPTATMR